MEDPTFVITASDGSSARIHLHGGHLVSWLTPDGREQLYLSEYAEYREGVAIRGGVPIVFPQFAERGPLPKHGFARIAHWQRRPGTQNDCASLQLATGPAYWPHAFTLELRIALAGRTLQLELEVTNTDSQPFAFTAALHTYLRVTGLSSVRLHGLDGLTYLDSTRAGEAIREASAAVVFDGEVDRIYLGTQGVELHEPDCRRRVRQWGFPDLVVWNPGPEKSAALADLPPGGYLEMICLEAAAAVCPITLLPGTSWRGGQRIEVLR